MKIKIAVADNDIPYITKLCAVLEKKDNVIISMFTETESLKKSLNNQKYDILLINPELDSEQLNYNRVAAVIFLADGTSSVFNVSCKKYEALMKYQQITRLFNEVLNIYSEVSPVGNLSMTKSSTAKVISVYSPAGGTGSSTVALALSEAIANRGAKAIYINFEMISSYGIYLKQTDGKNFGDIISKLDSKINWNLKINSILQTAPNGVMYFEEFKNIFDIYEISENDAGKLVEGIASADVCDYVIVDLDNDLSPVNRRIMSLSDTVVAVTSNSETANYKFGKFINHFDIIVDSAEKLCIVYNFGKAKDPAYAAYNTIASIPKFSGTNFKSVIEYINKNSLINIENLL